MFRNGILVAVIVETVGVCVGDGVSNGRCGRGICVLVVLVVVVVW